MSATWYQTLKLGTPINLGITSQNNNVFTFTYNLDDLFPDNFNSFYDYTVQVTFRTTNGTSWYIILSTKNNAEVFVTGSTAPSSTENFNLPSEGGNQTLWFDLNIPTDLDVGLNTSIGQNPTKFTIPLNVQSYDQIIIEVIRSCDNCQIGTSPELSVGNNFETDSQSEKSDGDVTNFYIGNDSQLSCLGLTTTNVNRQTCITPMTNFCNLYANHPLCGCINAPNNPTYAEEIKVIGPIVPYQCWAQPCIDGSAFNPTDPTRCPQEIQICAQIIDVSGTNNEIIDTPLYQNCIGKYGPHPDPDPTNDAWKYIIIGLIVLFAVILLVFLFLRLRKK